MPVSFMTGQQLLLTVQSTWHTLLATLERQRCCSTSWMLKKIGAKVLCMPLHAEACHASDPSTSLLDAVQQRSDIPRKPSSHMSCKRFKMTLSKTLLIERDEHQTLV